MKPAANQQISEYVLDRSLGAGTFGEVWLAHHRAWIDRRVAIKIPTDPQYIRSLQTEGMTLHGLEHSNIVRAIGFDPWADPPYLVMEYVPGTSLRPYVEKGPMPADQVVAVMGQILAGLAFAHEHGVIHRDIKPENILVHERAATEGLGAAGVVKITDFGMGQAMTVARESMAYTVSIDQADARHISGTFDYMSPEQRQGAKVDARTDLYAAGVVMFELLTGHRPAGTEVPGDLVPGIPASLDEAFRRSYARLDRRFESAGQFNEALSARVPPPLPSGPPPVPSHLGAVSTCPACHRTVDPHDQFCMNCGRQIAARVRRCPRCGAYPDYSDRFCLFCGETLEVAGNA